MIRDLPEDVHANLQRRAAAAGQSLQQYLTDDDERAGALARRRLQAAGAASAPDLVDVETVSVLRRRSSHGGLTDERFRGAVNDLLALPVSRFPTGALMPRAFELRANVTAYDACCVALAEALDCPLVTSDERLTNAPTINCPVEILRG